jgi:DNA recombination protein RmuC
MKPLREQLEKQEAWVKELEKSRARAYGEMGETLKQVLESHQQLRAETGRLTTALRRPDQRGRWGEVQLRRVVELAGMTEHCDFTEQTTIRDEGSQQRPDLIVMLPGGGRIAVDSKVPLDAYLDAVDDSAARESRRIDHANAVERRWKELAKKSYWENLEGSPELVVMFIPIESALMAAMEHKPTMHADAMAEKVLIATPTLLVGLLRSVAFGWRHETLARDARKIADVGRELYKRLQKFSALHGKVGQRLESAVRAYNESVGSLEGRLLSSGRRMQELGIAGDAIEDVSPITISPRLPAATLPSENDSGR